MVKLEELIGIRRLNRNDFLETLTDPKVSGNKKILEQLIIGLTAEIQRVGGQGTHLSGLQGQIANLDQSRVRQRQSDNARAVAELEEDRERIRAMLGVLIAKTAKK